MTDNSHIVITRRRWDYYFLPMLLCAGVIGIVTASYTQQLRPLGAPFAVILLWFMVRLRTPKEGMEVRTIRGTPGMIPMLIWLSCMLSLVVVLFALDYAISGQGFHDPMKWYHGVGFVIFMAVTFGGVTVIERRWIRPFQKMQNGVQGGMVAEVADQWRSQESPVRQGPNGESPPPDQ